MSSDKYKTVRLPKELVKRIDAIVKDKKYVYTSRADFVKEAVRLKLEDLKRLSALSPA